MRQKNVNPIEKSQDIIDIIRHALDWINVTVEHAVVTHDILEAELASVLEFFGEEIEEK